MFGGSGGARDAADGGGSSGRGGSLNANAAYIERTRRREGVGRGGWQIARQRGSHIILVKEGSMATLSVPDHREVAKGTLRSLIRASGMSVEEFLQQVG